MHPKPAPEGGRHQRLIAVVAASIATGGGGGWSTAAIAEHARCTLHTIAGLKHIRCLTSVSLMRRGASAP